MPQFKIGDRVQLVGDIARYYPCVVGTIVSNDNDPASVLNQFTVRLADDKEGFFFDFQLQTPAATVSRVIFDTNVTPEQTGTRGIAPGRHVHFVARDVDIHLRITNSGRCAIMGGVSAAAVPIKTAVVTLFTQDVPAGSVATDAAGEFRIDDVAPGDITLEVFFPSRRILATLQI